MIQFNLLPDVKLEYIRAAKNKRLVISISALVSAIVLVIVGTLTASVVGFQKQHIANLDKDIQTYRSELEGTEDLNKILTIQNQLNKLPGLHDQKPAASRLFDYISQLTPADVSYGKLDVDFAESKIEITGGAKSLSVLNQFVDTLKFTKYVVVVDETPGEETKAFSDVVLDSFSRKDKVTYKVTMKFDPAIFDNTKAVKLIVPKITSTRSELGKPFFEQIDTEEATQ